MRVVTIGNIQKEDLTCIVYPFLDLSFMLTDCSILG